MPAPVRLHVYLARAGVASRRHAEALVADGAVRLNGTTVRQQGVRVVPGTDRVEVRGQGVVLPEAKAWVMVHKPVHVISSASDPEGRPTVLDLIERARAVGPRRHEGGEPRLVPVGRLDFDAEGLILLSNDGALAAQLLHPRHHVPKTYLVKVRGRPDPGALERLRGGVALVDEGGRRLGRSAPAEVELVKISPHNSWLRMVLTEGRQHQVKRMVHAIGSRCLRLVRTDFAGLGLGDLPAGAWRHLTAQEVATLEAWPAEGTGGPTRRARRLSPPASLAIGAHSHRMRGTPSRRRGGVTSR